MFWKDRSLGWVVGTAALVLIAFGWAPCRDAAPGGALVQEVAPDPAKPVDWVVINRTNTSILVSIIFAEKTECTLSGLQRGPQADDSFTVRAGQSAGRAFLPELLRVPFHVAVAPEDDEGRVFVWCYRAIVRGRGDWMEVTRGEEGRLFIDFNPELKPAAPPPPQAATRRTAHPG